MCKIVYLTSRRFDSYSREFKEALAEELKSRNIEVVVKYANDFLNFRRKHKTYGIAIAFDFYRDKKKGSGITLNENCSLIGRDFAYNLSSNLDKFSPQLFWREFKFVKSDDKEWYRFFNKISSTTKAIFYLTTINNLCELENYKINFDDFIKIFADEIVRCLRSDYDREKYYKRVKLLKIQQNKKRTNYE